MTANFALVFCVIITLCIMFFAVIKVGIGLSNNPDKNDN